MCSGVKCLMRLLAFLLIARNSASSWSPRAAKAHAREARLGGSKSAWCVYRGSGGR